MRKIETSEEKEQALTKESYIKNQWHQEVEFLKNLKLTLIITIAIFFGSITMAAILGLINPELIDLGKDFIYQALGDITGAQTNSELFIFIAANNIQALTLMIIMGILPFIFLPAFTLITNGAIISVATFLGLEKMSFLAIIAHIMPHGIIELPMIWLSCALGFYLCLSVSKKIIGESSLKTALGNILRTYIMIIIPGTLLAAIIESYITPIIGSLFL
ncbi:MAG: stage II sporulation protein M [Clostridiales bacterium]